MRNIVLFLLFIFAFNQQAQSFICDSISDSILYVLPKNIESEIIHYLDSDSINPENKYYCYFTEVEDTITIMVTSYFRELHPKLKKLVHSTNRYLFIDNRPIPIIFRSDILLSTITNTYSKSSIIPIKESITMTGGGYYIKFICPLGCSVGKIIEIGYAQ